MVTGADVGGLGSGPFTDLAVMAVRLTGRCSAMATHRHVPTRPLPRVSAVAIDWRDLYYATGTGIFRRRLAARDTDAPPANDDIEHATPLTGPLPLRATFVIGHATLQAGEPADNPSGRSVWFAWRPAVSEPVEIYSYFGGISAFTGGPAFASLTPVPLVARPCGVNVVAGRTYWISVGSGPEPDYQPDAIAITRDLPAPCRSSAGGAYALSGRSG